MKFVSQPLIYKADIIFRVNKLEFPSVVLLRKFLGDGSLSHLCEVRCHPRSVSYCLGTIQSEPRGFIDVFDIIYQNSVLVYGSIRKLNGRISLEYMIGLLLEREGGRHNLTNTNIRVFGKEMKILKF
jgi:hypothetical protein